MNEEQLEFPVVSGSRAKRAKAIDLDFEARLRGSSFCPQCGQDYGMTAGACLKQKLKKRPKMNLTQPGLCIRGRDLWLMR
jgi:hypothetical protein